MHTMVDAVALAKLAYFSAPLVFVSDKNTYGP